MVMMAMLKTRTNWLMAKKMRSTVIFSVGLPAEDGEGGFQAAQDVLLFVHLRAAAPGQEGEQGKEGDKTADEQQGAADLLPGHARR